MSLPGPRPGRLQRAGAPPALPLDGRPPRHPGGGGRLYLGLPLAERPRAAGPPRQHGLAPARAGGPHRAGRRPSRPCSPPAARRRSGSLLLGVALPLLLAVALGPVFCSWACPFGLLSEALDGLRGRLAGRGRRWPEGGGAAGRAGPLGRPRRAARRLAPARRAAGRHPPGAARRHRGGAGGALPRGGLGRRRRPPRRAPPRRPPPAAPPPLPRPLPGRRGAGAAPRPRLAAGRLRGRRGCRCPAEAPCLHGCAWGVDPRREAASRRLHPLRGLRRALPDRRPRLTLLRPAPREAARSHGTPGAAARPARASPRVLPRTRPDNHQQ